MALRFDMINVLRGLGIHYKKNNTKKIRLRKTKSGIEI